MNVTRLFLGRPSEATITHVKSARSEVTRSWEELYESVAAISAGLRDLGIRTGDRILILSSSRVEVIECILAAFSMGATAMPVGTTMGRAAIQAIVRRMKPACCIFEDVPHPDVLQPLTEASCVLVSLKGVEHAAPTRCHAYCKLVEASAGRALAIPSFADEHPALIIHSSGSSGAPKVVVMGHGALLRYFEYHNFMWSQIADSSDSIVPTRAVVTGLPLSHLLGISLCLQGILNGGRSYLMSFFFPDVYLKLIERTRCACMLLAPSLYRSLLKEPHLHEMDRSALRCCILAGEACSLDLVRRIEAAFGVPAVMAYSMTECLSGIAHSRRQIFENRIKRGSCGRQLFGEVSLRNSDGSVCEDFGELWIRNPTVHPCYLDAAMNEARLQGGWFRTGDIFARDEDGDFFHRGRADDMFICNGRNIYPLEMEQLLLHHPGVEEVCAAPVTSPRKGAVPSVLVVASRPLSDQQVQDYFRRNGSTHTVPQFVMFADALPVLGPGKTDRRRVARLLQEAYDSAHGIPSQE